MSGLDHRAKGLAHPKPKHPRGQCRRRWAIRTRVRAQVKAQVFVRDGYTCRAFGVSPVCERKAWHRHELVPIGIGGQVATWNCIAICRRCHRACQNGIGGRRLVFSWPGARPNADRVDGIQATWNR